ncbi:MAG: MmcQ/YjbR family DNA-binding protein [Anaerolineae bacterium]
MNDDWLARLRPMCLTFPEAVEDTEGVGHPAFKVRGKIFAMQHAMDERPSLWFKGEPGMQATLINTRPEHFFVPPYVGKHGWIGVWLDVEQDWDYVEYLVGRSYRLTAPKKLVALLANQQG